MSDAIVFFFLFDPWVGRSKLSRTGVLEFHEVFLFLLLLFCVSHGIGVKHVAWRRESCLLLVEEVVVATSNIARYFIFFYFFMNLLKKIV